MIFINICHFIILVAYFIDEMANTQERLPYYEKLYQYIKSVHSDLR